MVVKVIEIVHEAAADFELGIIFLVDVCLQVFEEGNEAIQIGGTLQETLFENSLFVKVLLETLIEDK